MADFETKLRWLSERGSSVGAEELIARIEGQLAGNPMVVAAKQREGTSMTETLHSPATKPTGRFRGPAWGLAAFVAILGLAGLYLAFSGDVAQVAAQPTADFVESTLTAARAEPEPWPTDQTDSAAVHSATPPYEPGEYWWDPATEVSLHTHVNKGASGVVLSVMAVPPEDSPCDWIWSGCTELAELETRPTVVAGHDGVHGPFVVNDEFQGEFWLVAIEGTRILIQRGGQLDMVTEVDLAEAHAIVESLRTETWESQAGFRLIFTIPDGWY